MNSCLRLINENDIEQILAIYVPCVTNTPITFECEVPSLEEFKKRVLSISNTYPWLVYETNNKVFGYAYANKLKEREAYRWSVELSVYVDEKHRNKGIARGLYFSLIEILKIQGFCSSFAGITLPNQASIALHESIGFTPIGVYQSVGYKLGKWHDVGWWEMSVMKRLEAPPAPLALEKIKEFSSFKDALSKGMAHIKNK